jgi:hypothetical protein
MINPTSPYGMHANLQKIPKQCKAKIKVIPCDNAILVLVPIHQPIHNFVPNCMFNILMTCMTIHFHFLHKLGLCMTIHFHFLHKFGLCMTIHFHFLHKLGLCISQTPNLHYDYQQGLTFKYYRMGDYFLIYFTIILST